MDNPISEEQPIEESQRFEATVEAVSERITAVLAQVQSVYVGPREWPELLMVALLARGHVLLEGVPGIAKTTLARTFAESLGCSFGRVQFTPDLLPSDIIGTHIPVGTTGKFELRHGPVFAQIVLGDEINRAPAKTQSALLEAMQENQVTIEGDTLPLPQPFMVLATQNPVEHAGTFELPEAQLDRFLLRLQLDYPSADEEHEILRRFLGWRSPGKSQKLRALLDAETIQSMQNIASSIHCEPSVLEYAVGLVRFTRAHGKLSLGASPRAALALMQAAQAKALVARRSFVTPDDIRSLAVPVLAHRLVRTPEAEMDGFGQEQVIGEAFHHVPLLRPRN